MIFRELCGIFSYFNFSMGSVGPFNMSQGRVRRCKGETVQNIDGTRNAVRDESDGSKTVQKKKMQVTRAREDNAMNRKK